MKNKNKMLLLSWNTKDGNYCDNFIYYYDKKKPTKKQILRRLSEETGHLLENLEYEVISY